VNYKEHLYDRICETSQTIWRCGSLLPLSSGSDKHTKRQGTSTKSSTQFCTDGLLFDDGQGGSNLPHLHSR
jgi:hypothetical protein